MGTETDQRRSFGVKRRHSSLDSPGASGFALGLLAIKLCSGLIDGSLLDAGSKLGLPT